MKKEIKSYQKNKLINNTIIVPVLYVPKTRELTFSRTFPVYHARKGEATCFVEKFWTAVQDDYDGYVVNPFKGLETEHSSFCRANFEPKYHTIRAGKKWQVGDIIKPMVWAGKPYHKTKDGLWKIQFAPNTVVQQVYDFETNKDGAMFINGNRLYYYGDLSKNDGLSPKDFLAWFQIKYDEKHTNKPFSGQIICWADKTKVNY